MLVLSRQRDEAIIIGDNIRIVVVEIRGDKVRLGIDAPNTVSVHREEVWVAVHGRQPPTHDEIVSVTAATSASLINTYKEPKP